MIILPCRSIPTCLSHPSSHLIELAVRRQPSALQCPLYRSHKLNCLSLRQFATKRTAPTAKRKPIPTRSRVTQESYLPSHTSYANTLAARDTPTLLYLAPTDNTYQLACYLVGGFCLAYGCFHFCDVAIMDHPGLPAVVAYFTGSVSVIMMLLGGWMFLGARRLVGSINAVPTTTSSGGGSVGLRLRLEARRFFPVFGKGKVIECAPEDMQLAQRMQHTRFATENDPYPTAGRRPKSARERKVEAQREEEQRRQYELDHAYSAPFRHSWSALKGLRRGLGRIVRRDGFVQVNIKGKGTWRMDVKNGWCMDEGAALDRLLKTR